MTLKEASEILSEISYSDRLVVNFKVDQAIKLGREALKREQKRRHFFAPNIMSVLPGETKE